MTPCKGALIEQVETNGRPVDGQARGRDTAAEALVALMERFELPIFRYLFVLLGSREPAEDCTQETFVRAYRNLQRNSPVNATWLYTVGRNLAMDELRRQRRHAHSTDLERVPVEGIGESVAMRAAFAQLTPDDRGILYLLAVDGRSPREIGAFLGITESAVRMRVSRARQRLRKLYEVAP